MIEAKQFYKLSVEKQRTTINDILQRKLKSGGDTDPFVRLPFDTYAVINQEMDSAGWAYESYIDEKTDRRCASFYPKQLYLDVDHNDAYESDYAEPPKKPCAKASSVPPVSSSEEPNDDYESDLENPQEQKA